MLIHNKGLTADVENRGNISTSHGYLPTINRVPFVILSKASLKYQSAFCDCALFVSIWIGSCAEYSDFVTGFQSIFCLRTSYQEILKLQWKYRFINKYISCLLIAFIIIISQEVPWRQQALNNWWAWKLFGSVRDHLQFSWDTKSTNSFETSGSRHALVRISIVFVMPNIWCWDNAIQFHYNAGALQAETSKAQFVSASVYQDNEEMEI